MSTVPPIDWQRIVLNLRSAGLPVAEQARRIKVNPETLRHYANGEAEEPKFTLALRLLDLHYDLCPDRHRLEELRK